MLVRRMVMALVLCGMMAGGALADEINPVVGKAGDFVLRLTDLERLVASLPSESRQQVQDNPEQQVLLARELLQSRAVAAAARKAGYDRKPEVKEQIDYLVTEFIAREYVQKVVLADVKVTDIELLNYYRQHSSEFVRPEEVKARHIFVDIPDDATPEAKAKARAKAEGLLARLKKGEDFALVAKEGSEDPDSAPKGGELGMISAGRTNDETFEKAALALKAGSYSDVVATKFGLHIIKVDEKVESKAYSFNEVQEYLRQKLQKEAEKKRGEEFLEQAGKEAGLVIFPEAITGKKEDKEKKKEPAS